MRTKKRTTVYHCRLDAERIKEMEKMNQKEVNEIMETETVELTLTKEQLKTLKLVLGGLDNYLIGHVINGEMDEVEAVSHIMSIYNRIVDMEKGEK